MNSNEVKAAVFRHARKIWKPLILLDETSANHGVADVFVMKGNLDTIEIEVKVSMVDLKAEIKKSKYQTIYWDNVRGIDPPEPGEHRHRSHYPSKDDVLTNFYYLAVPVDILDKAEPYIKEAYPYAGIISCYRKYTMLEGRIVRRAPRLHHKRLSDKIRLQLFYRLSGKYCHNRVKFWEGDNELRV